MSQKKRCERCGNEYRITGSNGKCVSVKSCAKCRRQFDDNVIEKICEAIRKEKTIEEILE